MKKIFGILAVVFSLIVIGCSNPAAMDSVPEAKWEVAAVGESTVKVTNAPDSKYIDCYVHQNAMWSNGEVEFTIMKFNANFSNYATTNEAVVGINNLLKGDTVYIYYSAEKKNTVWINADDFTEAEKADLANAVANAVADVVLVTDN